MRCASAAAYRRPMSRRNVHLLALMALGAAALLLAAAPSALATFPGHNGLIAFHSETSAGNQIFTVRPNGKDLRQLTHINGDAGSADWSPDGRLIAFDIWNENAGSVAIMNADGSNLRVLPHPDGIADVDPSFTPDGRRLVVVVVDLAADTDTTWTMDLDGTDRRVLLPRPAEDPNLSPDGRSVAFLGFDGAPPGALMTASVPGNHVRQLTPFTFDVGSKLDWTPDGRQIGFIHNANLEIPGQSANIATIRSDGTDLRFVTHYSGGDVNAYFGSYSPNGRWIVFRLEYHGRYGLYKMRPDGSHLKTILPLSDFAPRFIDWGARATDRDEDGDE
jgi:Tol biopolymer transport system component